MLDLKLVRQNAQLKAKDNFYTWIAPDRVIAMIDEIERLRAMQQGYREEASELRIQNEEMRSALSAFATSENWHMGGRFDPNSPRFDGQGFAQHVLESSTDAS